MAFFPVLMSSGLMSGEMMSSRLISGGLLRGRLISSGLMSGGLLSGGLMSDGLMPDGLMSGHHDTNIGLLGFALDGFRRRRRMVAYLESSTCNVIQPKLSV